MYGTVVVAKVCVMILVKNSGESIQKINCTCRDTIRLSNSESDVEIRGVQKYASKIFFRGFFPDLYLKSNS